MELPKLRRIRDKSNKKKMLLLSDDLRLHSGIATMSKEIVLNTVHVYDWVQLGAAPGHPDHSKIIDISNDVQRITGIEDASIKIYAHDGYGNQNVVRELIEIEKPDALIFFTDPRFWGWLVEMEDEIRSKIPIIYYNIWDCPPAPMWNISTYESCDMILNISKQTHQLVKNVLNYEQVDLTDITNLYSSEVHSSPL